MQSELGDVLRSRTAQEWETVMSAAGIPCGMVREVGEAASMPHLAERGLRLPLTIPGLPDGKQQVEIVNAGFRMSEDGPSVDVRPPRLGEHTREILAWLNDAQ